MDHKENFQNLPRADLLRVIHQLHHLVMAGAATAHLLIAGLKRLPIGVARFHIQHPFDAHKHRFRAPETTTSKRQGLKVWVHVWVP